MAPGAVDNSINGDYYAAANVAVGGAADITGE